jgi:hypothetical protein
MEVRKWLCLAFACPWRFEHLLAVLNQSPAHCGLLYNRFTMKESYILHTWIPTSCQLCPS